MARELFYIIAYDITSDRIRTRLVKLLKDYGQRVNYSVFECWIQQDKLKELKTNVANIVDEKSDQVLFYNLCATCRSKKDVIGIEEAADESGEMIWV